MIYEDPVVGFARRADNMKLASQLSGRMTMGWRAPPRPRGRPAMIGRDHRWRERQAERPHDQGRAIRPSPKRGKRGNALVQLRRDKLNGRQLGRPASSPGNILPVCMPMWVIICSLERPKLLSNRSAGQLGEQPRHRAKHNDHCRPADGTEVGRPTGSVQEGCVSRALASKRASGESAPI